MITRSLWQFALLHIEDMVEASQGNAARVCPRFVSLLPPFIFLQPLPEDHWTALISLADMAANLFGLLVR